MTAVQDALFGPETATTTPTHVLSWGLGADSTAILLRWLHQPSSRDFDLDQLVVVTAHTGNEYPSTIRDAEEVVLPARTRSTSNTSPPASTLARACWPAAGLVDTMRAAGLSEVLDIFAGHVAAQEHGLYEVRRVATARRDRQIQRGPIAQLRAVLEELPGELVTGADGITRLSRHHRGDVEPWVEHFHVVAPTVDAQDKQRPGFEAMYAAATGGIPALI